MNFLPETLDADTDLTNVKSSSNLQSLPVESKEDDAATLKFLSTISELEYDRQRKQFAKKLGVRPSTLDRLVQMVRKTQEQQSIVLDNVQPWSESVNANQLLNEIRDTIHRYIVCDQETAITVSLWTAMTWFIDSIQIAPLAIITAPEKRCGKTQLLLLLSKLVYRPLMASNISPSALFRSIDAWQPTLLIDVADAFLCENEELRGLINCGHSRDSAFIIRVVGENFVPTRFNVWGAKAISGIGHLADTLMDRAVIFKLRRKLPYETVERLRYADPGLFLELSAKLARFAQDNREQIKQARPVLPSELNDRAQDNWEALLAIADIAGGDWPLVARKTALKISGIDDGQISYNQKLLADIHEVFRQRQTNKIFTDDLIKTLCQDEEKGWSVCNRNQPITSRQISEKLKGYNIHSKDVRLGQLVKKGYYLDDFTDAFSRYLSEKNICEDTANFAATTLHDCFDKGFSVANIDPKTLQTQCSATQKSNATRQPTEDKACSVVAANSTEQKHKFSRQDVELF